MWLAHNSQSRSRSSLCTFCGCSLLHRQPFPCSLSPEPGTCGAALQALFPRPGVFFPLLWIHPSAVCVSQSRLSLANKKAISASLELKEESSHGLWHWRGAGKLAVENEMEARDFQKAWGHTSGTIWWACLHHSCDLPDRQVAPVWGYRVHSQSPCLRRLWLPSGYSQSRCDWRQSLSSRREKLQWEAASGISFPTEECAQGGSPPTQIQGRNKKRDWTSKSPSTFCSAHRARSPELLAKPLPPGKTSLACFPWP